MRALLLIVLGGLIVWVWFNMTDVRVQSGGPVQAAPQPTVTPTSIQAPLVQQLRSTPTQVPSQPTPPAHLPTQAQDGGQGHSLQAPPALTAQEAASWCRVSGCTPDQFRPLTEANGVLNPRGLIFDGQGGFYTFSLPAKVAIDSWDGFQAQHGVRGPITVQKVAGVTLRDFR